MRTESIQDIWRKAWRFCLVGGLVFGVDYALLWFLSHFLPVLAAVSTAYLLAVLLHFLLNKCWVFVCRSRDLAWQLLRYSLAVLACWFATVFIVAISLKALTPNIYLAKAVAIPPTTLLGFVLMKQFVFRPNLAVKGHRQAHS